MLFMLIAIIVLVILVLYVIFLFNRVKKQAINVEEAFAGIETYLEERFDMLTKVISTANEEARREIEMQTNITELRTAFDTASTLDEKLEAGMRVESAMPALLATAENYPDPQFNAAFRQVQRGIMAIEDKLSAARRNYNATVGRYNKMIATFPAGIVASIFGFKSKAMFEATEHKREDIDIDSMWG